MHSYKNGNPIAKEMSDEEALKYAEDFHIPMPEIKDVSHNEAPANDQDAIAAQLQQVAGVPAIPEPEEETPAKTPKKATGGRKRKTATPAVDTDAKPVAASPVQKRRRTSTKAAVEPTEEPKKSGRKKAKSS